MCTSVCMYKCVYISVCPCVPVCICVYMCLCVSVCVLVHVCVSGCASTCACLCVSVSVYVYGMPNIKFTSLVDMQNEPKSAKSENGIFI